MEVESTVSAKPHTVEIPTEDLPIDKVFIYTNQSEVKRSIKVHVPQGEVELRITNFRAFMRCNNWRIGGKDHKYVRALRMEGNEVTYLDSTEVLEAKNKLDVLNPKYRKLYDEQHVLKTKIGALDTLLLGLTKERLEEAAFERKQNYYAKEMKKLKSEILDLDEKIGKVLKEINNASTELQQAQSDVSFPLTLIISLDSPGGDLDLSLTYLVANASWSTKYNIFVDTSYSTPSLEVQYLGEIDGKHGDEWINAPVILSTGDPSWFIKYPILTPARVKLEPKKSETKRKSSDSWSEINDENEETAPTPEKKQKKEPKFEFVIAKPLTFRRHSDIVLLRNVEISSFKAEPILTHRCVPSQKEAVFLTAQITNNSGLTLLPGKVSVFLNGSLAQEYSLGESVEPGEKFRVNLGEDSLVKVTYPEARQTSVEGGYLSYETSKVTEQEIVIKNNRSEPVQLELKEAVPKSEDGRIKVTLLSPEPLNTSPRPTDSSSVGIWLSEDNTLDWTVSVNPAEEKTLLVKYSIRYPVGTGLVLVDSS